MPSTLPLSRRRAIQKLINRPEDFVDEVLAGILAAHPEEPRLARDSRAIVRRDAPVQDKVAIATGGGSGHLPVFMGYVGHGLADGAAIGNVFASPSSDQMLAVIQAIDAGRGVLQIYGNYGGDVMNFGLAAELATDEGVRVESVLCTDDVASAPKGEEPRRRGIAGIFFLYKITGARAQEGADLDELKAVAERTVASVRSMGVALSPCTIPSAAEPTFELPPGEMEIGMGIHGEPGVRRGPLQTADEVTDAIMDSLLADLPATSGSDRVDVLVNGLGATPPEELYIVFRRVAERLDTAGLAARRVWIGEYATSLEMAGASISLMLVDDEMAGLMDAPASSPFFVRR